MTSARPVSSALLQLTRIGFLEPKQALQRLQAPELAGFLGVVADAGADNPEENLACKLVQSNLVLSCAHAADPDQALLGLIRVIEAIPPADAQRQVQRFASPAGERITQILGASTALTDHLVRHCDDLEVFDEVTALLSRPSADVHADLLRAVGADPTATVPIACDAEEATVDHLRQRYRRRIVEIACADVIHPEPTEIMDEVAAALADVAGAALEGALAIARAEHSDSETRLAVIGMGKCGARELNYVSDVDVIYVVEPGPHDDDDEAVMRGTKLAMSLQRVCGAPSGEPALWQIDPALRPEGKNGPLVRTLASHRSYYEQWAKTWEFQALLKARAVAGDAELGEQYMQAVNPLVWQAVEREHFVQDAQAMRRRVIEHIPSAEVEREIKLGPGGLRDVEFTVQLLQLVHGRSDETLHVPSTLVALEALSAGGYVGRDHAAQLDRCYRYLRVLEHRIQLYRLRRTHLMPTQAVDLRRLARGIGKRGADAEPEALLKAYRSVRRQVRHLHEELYYRPLLPATASLSADDAALSPEAAKARLAALGYRDPAGAIRHIAALTEGMSRRVAIQRQLLPVMLGWFADGSDPDAALLAFRRISEKLGSIHWYLKLLRDSQVAAYRLATVLSTSRYLADGLDRSPESVAWFGSDAELAPRDHASLHSEMSAVLSRQTDAVSAARGLRALRRRELMRIACAHVLDLIDAGTAMHALTDVTDVVLDGALRTVEKDVAHMLDVTELPTRLVVVAMGRLGGREIGYGSDADVVFFHDPVLGADPQAADQAAIAMVTRFRALLSDSATEPPIEVDIDLRPEGRNGPVARTLASLREYFERWADTWERQALTKARPVAGDRVVQERYLAIIDPLRYPAAGLDPKSLRDIRMMKARIESERLPRGVDPGRHLKLGRGGLTDVEWVVQTDQLAWAYVHPQLRTTSTLTALTGLAEVDVLAADDVEVLAEAWSLASEVRSAIVLATGKTRAGAADVVPHDIAVLNAVARLVAGEGASGAELEEEYLRVARRARAVMERVFYG